MVLSTLPSLLLAPQERALLARGLGHTGAVAWNSGKGPPARLLLRLGWPGALELWGSALGCGLHGFPRCGCPDPKRPVWISGLQAVGQCGRGLWASGFSPSTHTHVPDYSSSTTDSPWLPRKTKWP